MTVRQELELCASRGTPGRHDMSGVLLEINPESETLVVSCSGIVPEQQLIYAMENSTQNMPTNKLFICDIHSLWYYSGIEGITSSFYDTVSLIDSIRSSLNPVKTCAIGTSGGGYMALALTSLLQFNRALAMSPQTTIHQEHRKLIGDGRWQRNMDVINKIAVPYDILELVLHATSPQFYVIYPHAEQLDAVHAQRIREIANVRTFELDTDDHNVSSFMRSVGVLQSCLDEFITSPDDELSSRLTTCLSAYTKFS